MNNNGSSPNYSDTALAKIFNACPTPMLHTGDACMLQKILSVVVIESTDWVSPPVLRLSTDIFSNRPTWCMNCESFFSSMWRLSSTIGIRVDFTAHLHGVLVLARPLTQPGDSPPTLTESLFGIKDSFTSLYQCAPVQTFSPNWITWQWNSRDTAILRTNLPISVQGSHQRMRIPDTREWSSLSVWFPCCVSMPFRESRGHFLVSHLDARFSNQGGKYADY